MIIRTFKAIALGTVAFYAARAAKAQAKILAIRTEAKQQMDDLLTKMQDLFPVLAPTEETPSEEKRRQFMAYMDEYSRISKIYHKTF